MPFPRGLKPPLGAILVVMLLCKYLEARTFSERSAKEAV